MTPAGVLTTLVKLAEITGSSATAPNDLVQGSDGNFYGTTERGGVNDKGTVFKLTPAGVLTTLVKFTSNDATIPNGLVQGSGGNFYGTTKQGGASGYGTVFKMTPAGVLTTLVEFTGNGTINKGEAPIAGLVQGSDGNFYGTTSVGGTNAPDGHYGYGTVFKMTPAGVLTTLVTFTDNGATNMGVSPNGLVLGSDGNFYGKGCEPSSCALARRRRLLLRHDLQWRRQRGRDGL
jgi:uncharacterized repeat protein (TIGR03803 family)